MSGIYPSLTLNKMSRTFLLSHRSYFSKFKATIYHYCCYFLQLFFVQTDCCSNPHGRFQVIYTENVNLKYFSFSILEHLFNIKFILRSEDFIVASRSFRLASLMMLLNLSCSKILGVQVFSGYAANLQTNGHLPFVFEEYVLVDHKDDFQHQ